MIRRLIYIITSSFFYSLSILSQSVCNNLCVSDIEVNDTLGGVNVEVVYNAMPNTFLRYPGVTAMYNANMDTLYLGSWGSFMPHFSGPRTYWAAQYAVTANVEDIKYVDFVYQDTLSGLYKTCLLPYPCNAELCNQFCPTNIELDSTGSLAVDIFYDDTASAFISYPLVQYVFDNNGDTIGEGTLNFFGQIGGSSQTYTLSTNINTLDSNFEGYIMFIYGDQNGENQVCYIDYPCRMTAIIEAENTMKNIEIFPNPFTNRFQIPMEEEGELYLINPLGHQVLRRELNQGVNTIDITEEYIGKGVYIAVIINRNGNRITQMKMIKK